MNDSFDHRAGDEVIPHVARQIEDSVRNTGQVFRFGDKEFVVLLNNVDCETGCVIADRALAGIGDSSVVYLEECLRVTASIVPLTTG